MNNRFLNYEYKVNTTGLINNPAVPELRNASVFSEPVPLLDTSKITGGRLSIGYTEDAAVSRRVAVQDEIITIKYAAYANSVALYNSKMILPAGAYILEADCRMEHDDEVYTGLTFFVGKYPAIGDYSTYSLANSDVSRYVSVTELHKWEHFKYTFTLDEEAEIFTDIQPMGDKNNYLNIPLQIKNLRIISADSITIQENKIDMSQVTGFIMDDGSLLPQTNYSVSKDEIWMGRSRSSAVTFFNSFTYLPSGTYKLSADVKRDVEIDNSIGICFGLSDSASYDQDTIIRKENWVTLEKVGEYASISAALVLTEPKYVTVAIQSTGQNPDTGRYTDLPFYFKNVALVNVEEAVDFKGVLLFERNVITSSTEQSYEYYTYQPTNVIITGGGEAE